MKECKLLRIFKKSYRIKMLVEKEAGLLRCWRNENRKCSSDCTAWHESFKKIKCMALPKTKNSSNIIAILKKEKDNGLPEGHK